MEFKNILYAVDEKICTITINRPDKLNALTIETINELREAVIAANLDEEVKGIILTGSGSKAFVAGADITEFSNLSPEQAKALAKNGHSTFDMIENSGKPIIAAINGFALGGGCELAMACHIRIAATNAKFGQPEINLGLIPGYGGTQRLVRLIGFSKATELLLTADMVNAEEAKELKIVNWVVEPDQLLLKAKEILGKIITKSPLVVTQILHLMNKYYSNERPGFELEIDEFGNCFSTQDQTEGVSAFLEKRKANFIGK